MIKKVGIVGFGQMGSGIAQVAAAAGFKVIVNEVTEDLLEKGKKGLEKRLNSAIEKGKLDEASRNKTLGNLSLTTELEPMADCDLIIEAVTEDMAAKKEVFAELDRISGPATIFASNTSSLPIGDLSAATRRRDKFIGLHFFNPVPIMKLVEVVRTIDTSDETFQAAKTFGEAVGKVAVCAKDSPGFIVNVLLIPYLLDAIRKYENGLASRDDIDNAMKLGCGHPMGPLTLTDFIGLDTVLYIGDIFFEEFKDSHYAAPPLLRRMVKAGYLGKKTGRGFYDYGK